jgi:hypothetical protein
MPASFNQAAVPNGQPRQLRCCDGATGGNMFVRVAEGKADPE